MKLIAKVNGEDRVIAEGFDQHDLALKNDGMAVCRNDRIAEFAPWERDPVATSEPITIKTGDVEYEQD